MELANKRSCREASSLLFSLDPHAADFLLSVGFQTTGLHPADTSADRITRWFKDFFGKCETWISSRNWRDTDFIERWRNRLHEVFSCSFDVYYGRDCGSVIYRRHVRHLYKRG